MKLEKKGPRNYFSKKAIFSMVFINEKSYFGFILYVSKSLWYLGKTVENVLRTVWQASFYQCKMDEIMRAPYGGLFLEELSDRPTCRNIQKNRFFLFVYLAKSESLNLRFFRGSVFDLSQRCSGRAGAPKTPDV